MAEVRNPATESTKKGRGAFFTHPTIAHFLVNWAVQSDEAKVLDPTCGEGVFLSAAGEKLRGLGASTADLDSQVFGVDIHRESLEDTSSLLEADGLDATLLQSDFFEVFSPDQIGGTLPRMDAVVGNPPFVRYQLHKGRARKIAAEAAMSQGVRLSGLASSWAPLLVHASAFLKPEGRLAMVLPAELLTVHYAEEIRLWLKRRFSWVGLVVFERLQFDDALENVVLLLARGSGGCDAFSLYFVEGREDLNRIQPFDEWAATPSEDGKWTDLLLPPEQRHLFRQVVADWFTPLQSYGTVGLGSVTGGNGFFTLSESTREEYGLKEEQLVRISPPGTRHLAGPSFTPSNWEKLREADERVWLLHPGAEDKSPGLRRYIEEGEAQGVHEAYKCRIRSPWWRPPVVESPDLFFTYMSHRFPRLINNSARVSFVNSMHGLWAHDRVPKSAVRALPLLGLNSVTLLGAEVFGRSYGGGILKMEPREAAELPLPSLEATVKAWELLKPERSRLSRELANGGWTSVLARIDEVLLRDVLGLSSVEAETLHDAARSLRDRRLSRKGPTA